MNSKHLKIALITSCFVGASGALAQTTASAEAPSAAAAEEFADEIIVTAQRRSQRYVDVPTSVSVTTGDQLAAAGANGSRDLDLLTPGLNITQQGTYVQPTIRGVGTTVTGTGADPNIAIYVDGVYLSGQGTALFEFNNIAQIEVLKGPQGALYGRNATGGAIVVSTVAPSLG
ncbi:MAG: Plug domain-containing protein, partial [Sphingomonadaceae bacterium]|nr:Plug domain-containing protein [Sphingomonadaceae bacterium]